MRRKNRRIVRSVIAGLLLLFPLLVSLRAAAAGGNSITLICCRDETVLTGMEWKLYRIGVRHDTAVEFVPELSGYSMDLGDLSVKAVDTAAKTIESYVTAAGLAPVAQGQTDAAGSVTFGGLNNGLYLASGKTLQIGNTIYVPSALLMEINNSNTELDYDAYPKFYYTTLSEETKEYTVKKVWIDSENANGQRPAELTVDLYKNGQLQESVVLNESNGWEYSWKTKDDGSEWTVAEREIPEPYAVMIDSNSTQFLIRNTYQETTTTEGSTTETTETTETTTEPPVTEPAVTTTTPSLVQTGQLWWPVIPLALGGVILVGAGISMRAGKKKDER